MYFLIQYVHSLNTVLYLTREWIEECCGIEMVAPFHIIFMAYPEGLCDCVRDRISDFLAIFVRAASLQAGATFSQIPYRAGLK